MQEHVKTLGVIRIVLGALMALIGLGLFVLLGGLAGIAGTVGARQDPNAMVGAGVLGVVGLGLLILFGLLAIPSIIAGVGLLKYKVWARWLTIVLSAFDLVNVPIGTAVGIYGLWVLLTRDTELLFDHYRARQLG